MDINRNILISYLKLRKAVGILGFSFPIILVIGSVLTGNCDEIQGSISAYYHTAIRDVFVGVLCIVAFFMFAYNGYEKEDIIASNLACFFALGVAMFPTDLEQPYSLCSILYQKVAAGPILQANKLTAKIHYIFAALLFLTFTYFSLVLFTRSEGFKTREKIKRNLVYKVCGVIMLLCILLLSIYFLFFQKTPLMQYKPVFWLESLALMAFGFSWLTKGELILQDKFDIRDNTDKPAPAKKWEVENL